MDKKDALIKLQSDLENAQGDYNKLKEKAQAAYTDYVNKHDAAQAAEKVHENAVISEAAALRQLNALRTAVAILEGQQQEE